MIREYRISKKIARLQNVVAGLIDKYLSCVIFVLQARLNDDEDIAYQT